MRLGVRFFDTPLGRIQDSCADLGLPSLPVMVVRKNGMKPGIGYAAHYRKAHPEAAGMSDSEIGAAQWEAVRHCEDWQALLDYYRIVKKFAGVKDPAAELKAKESYEEGRRISERISDEVRRNRDARIRCIEIKGTTCVVCGFNSADAYGVEGIIHVHHLRPLFELAAGEKSNVDPERDLVPVCPNCHALIHGKGPREWYTIEETRNLVSGVGSRGSQQATP